LPAYPAEKDEPLGDHHGDDALPALERDEALERLGEDFFRGFSSTLIGQALKAMMRVIGTRRSLQRMERNFRTGNNYMETRSPRSAPVRRSCGSRTSTECLATTPAWCAKGAALPGRRHQG